MSNSTNQAGVDSVESLMRNGHFTAALQKLKPILQDKPEDIDALYLSAVCHRYLKNYKQALDALSTLKLLVPDHSRAMQEQGHILLAQQQPNTALEAYARATQLNPKKFEFTFLLN